MSATSPLTDPLKNLKESANLFPGTVSNVLVVNSTSNYKNQVRDELFPRKTSKSEQTKLKILESAIHCYALTNANSLSFEDLAKRANVTRPLIHKYFPDRQELFRQAMKLVRARLLQIALEAIQATSDPKNKLIFYVKACFIWVEKEPVHAKVWMFYFYMCGVDKDLKRDHLAMTTAGAQRIESILKELEDSGHCPSIKDSYTLAKTIQKLITGAIVEIVSELPSKEIPQVCDETVDAVLKLVGVVLNN